MEMLAPPEGTDEHLLAQMFEHDMISNEIFRRVYGIGYRKQYDAFNKNGKLTEPVRSYCIEFLAKKRPHTADPIAHAALPA